MRHAQHCRTACAWVIIPNKLAPVVTVQANYIVGGNETPDGFPGMAHAEEHMAFRGCTGMTADQTAAIYALLGGQDNADTQQNITQFFTTVPAGDVNLALHALAACLSGIDDAQAEWDQERGAIEQEVQRDLSNPTYKFIDRLNTAMFAGTPYSHDPLGTKASFDATTGAMLKDFYQKWYSPSNMVLVVVAMWMRRRRLPRSSNSTQPHQTMLCRRVRRSICSRSRRTASPSTATCPMFWDLLRTGCRHRLPGFCGFANSWRRAGERARRFVRNGSSRQGAGR